MSMQVSIIIPNLHSPVLDLTLRSIKQQEYNLSQVEVFVIGLDRYNLIHPSRRVHIVETDGSVSEARNLGIQVSKGRFLVFLDSDCIATEKWLVELVSTLRQGHPVVGGGVAIPGGSYWATSYNISTFHEFLSCTPAGMREYLPTLNLAMHREVAEKVGQLDGELPRAEDIDWTTRMREMGYPLYFNPEATIYHQPITSLRRIWGKWINTGFCSWRVRSRYADQLTVRSVLNHPYLLLLLSPAVAALRTGDIFISNRALLRYWYSFPIVYFTKIAWCWGAAAAGGIDWMSRLLFRHNGRLLT